MKISVVTPVYSEDASLPPLMESLCGFLGADLLEVIMVYHPNSSPQSLMVMKQLGEKYPMLNLIPQDLAYKGNGSAFRQGFTHVKGTHVLMIDSDGEMDIKTLPLLIQKMNETQCDMVIGARFMKGGGVEGYSAKKLALSRLYHLLFRALFRTRLRDLTYGYKFMKVSVLKQFVWTAKFQNIGCETTLKPLKGGCRIEQVSTVWRARESGIANSLSLKGNLRYVTTAWAILTQGVTADCGQ